MLYSSDIYKAIELLANSLTESIDKTSKITKSADLMVIDDQLKKQQFELQLAHMQAKVAQEIAIAQRIENASEVIIEEYYEGETKGKVGITGDENGLNLGVSGEHRKITKKIYKFIGNDKSNITDVEIENQKSIEK